MNYKVLILTSGIGSRLGELTKNLNKALVPVAGKPTISYVIESYPKEVEFVVTLGYLGDQVREALTKLHPDRKITFVNVDKFDGPGSSQNYSTLAAKSHLQCPFIFHCCDTIITEPIPQPDRNWSAGFKLADNAQYRTLNVKGEKILSINDKGAPNFDYIHIGLVGIKDYEAWWRLIQKQYELQPENQKANDTDVINAMITQGKEFYFVPVKSWHDIGNPLALTKTRLAIK